MSNFAILTTDEFLTWWSELSQRSQKAVAIKVEVLAEKGVDLGYPHTSKIFASRHTHMRELRIRNGRNTIRVLYAFDPNRKAILLIGAHKNSDIFYTKHVPLADKLYDRHLENLHKGEQEQWRPITYGRN